MKKVFMLAALVLGTTAMVNAQTAPAKGAKAAPAKEVKATPAKPAKAAKKVKADKKVETAAPTAPAKK